MGTVRRVCLPSSSTDTYEGKMGTVAGWGLLREGGSRPTVLMELTMKIWGNQKCSTTYGSTAPAGIKDSMMCAGKQGKDSCSGDSGGPFVTPVGDHWEQIGVVSWGIGCGKQHYPGVYTRVSEMMEWIDKVRKLILTRRKTRTAASLKVRPRLKNNNQDYHPCVTNLSMADSIDQIDQNITIYNTLH